MRPLQLGFLKKWGLSPFLLLAAAQSMHASACPTAPLSTYDVPSFSCDFGGFTLTDFAFTVGPLSGGAPTFLDSSITVTPTTGLERFGLSFTMTGWAVTSPMKGVYTITYTWDPGPIRSLEEVMEDPPTGAGSTSIVTTGCLGGPFPCGFSTTSVTVSDPGSLTNSVSFAIPLSGIVGVQHVITLDTSVSGTADLISMGSTVVIPEPGTILGGLLALAVAAAKLRSKRL